MGKNTDKYKKLKRYVKVYMPEQKNFEKLVIRTDEIRKSVKNNI